MPRQRKLNLQRERGPTVEQRTRLFDASNRKRPPAPAEAPTAAPAKAKGRKSPALSEAAIQRQIIDLLEVHGWLVTRTNKFCGKDIASQGAIEPGMPDLMARKGRWSPKTNFNDGGGWKILWIECKRPGGKVSVKQATWHQLAQRRGETVIVAENVETVARVIGVKL